jgi:hypothetical protein
MLRGDGLKAALLPAHSYGVGKGIHLATEGRGGTDD